MPVNMFPFTGLTVFEKQEFSNTFTVPAGTTVSSYSISTTDTVGAGWSDHVTVTSNATTSIVISGYYDNVFNLTTINTVDNHGVKTTYNTFDSVPTNPYPYAITGYAPDSRNQIQATVTINCNTGSTSITQYIRNDYNYCRNRIITLIHNCQVDAKTNTTYVAPALPSPCPIDSESLKNVFIFTTSITSNIQNWNLATAAIAAGYTQTNALYASISIAPGVYVWSDTTSVAAFMTGTLPAGVGTHAISITNNGYIIGKGGDGGEWGITVNGVNGKGVNGGPAMSLGANITLTNNSYIAGGGGGGGTYGGGGAGGGNGAKAASATRGGLGGLPGLVGGNGSASAYAMDGGGGGRILPGVGGIPCVTNSGHAGYGGGAGGGAGGGRGSIGAPIDVGGNGGSANNPGQDGVGPFDAIQFGTGVCGGGGGWGAAGGAHTATGGSGSFYAAPGGTGGAAIVLNGYTVTYVSVGNVWGTVA